MNENRIGNITVRTENECIPTIVNANENANNC